MNTWPANSFTEQSSRYKVCSQLAVFCQSWSLLFQQGSVLPLRDSQNTSLLAPTANMTTKDQTEKDVCLLNKEEQREIRKEQGEIRKEQGGTRRDLQNTSLLAQQRTGQRMVKQ